MKSTGNTKNAGNLGSPRPAVRKEDKNNINTSGGVRRNLKLGENQTDANSIVPAVRKEGKIKFTIRRGQEEPQTGGTSVPAVRKGVALATQTVVLLVLAAIVLGSILIFFMNIFNPQEKGFATVAEQTTLCQAQIRFDPKCKTPLPIPTGTPQKGLIDVCKSLNYEKCQGSPTPELCIQQCCANFCG